MYYEQHMRRINKQHATSNRHAQTLLISGTSGSPDSAKAEDKTRSTGAYLHGISHDIKNMEHHVVERMSCPEKQQKFGHLFHVLHDSRATKKTVLQSIRNVAREAGDKHGPRLRRFWQLVFFRRYGVAARGYKGSTKSYGCMCRKS